MRGYSAGSSVAASVISSPLMGSMMHSMHGGIFELVGAPTPEVCEGLRPRETKLRIDGRCQPVRLTIY